MWHSDALWWLVSRSPPLTVCATLEGILVILLALLRRYHFGGHPLPLLMLWAKPQHRSLRRVDPPPALWQRIVGRGNLAPYCSCGCGQLSGCGIAWPTTDAYVERAWDAEQQSYLTGEMENDSETQAA